MKLVTVTAVAALAFVLPVAAASPATAMEIKKDDNCLTLVPPSAAFNGGDPQIDDGTVAVHNCITVSP